MPAPAKLPAKIIDRAAAEMLKHERMTSASASGARLNKLGMALEFLDSVLPPTVEVIGPDADGEAHEGRNMLKDMQPAVATAYATTLVAMLDFVAAEYARPADGKG